MISCTEFIPAYSELFAYIEENTEETKLNVIGSLYLIRQEEECLLRK